MAAADAPQWLGSAWRRSVENVGATAPVTEIDRVGADLVARWQADDRVHHNLKRLIGVLARVDELAAETHDPDVVRLAAWYHGSVFTSDVEDAYARRGGIDPDASAELARTELGALGVPSTTVERVVELVRSMLRHAPSPHDIDAQALCDADLGALAAEPQRYESYLREVRAEWSHIPERDYAEARVAILGRLLERRALFASPLGAAWEDRARDNLRAERERLQHELAQLPPRPEGEESLAEEVIRAKMAKLDAADAVAIARGPVPEPARPRTAADRVDVARRSAQERADERRAQAAADRERRMQRKSERIERRQAERVGARGDVAVDEGSSMSRPPAH